MFACCVVGENRKGVTWRASLFLSAGFSTRSRRRSSALSMVVFPDPLGP